MRVMDVTIVPPYEGYNRASSVAEQIEVHLIKAGIDKEYKDEYVVRVTLDKVDRLPEDE